MAAGRTTAPLTIDIDVLWADHPEIQKLRAAGHTIRFYGCTTPSDRKPDLIIHPAAHGWNDLMWSYLPAAVTAARARRRREAKIA